MICKISEKYQIKHTGGKTGASNAADPRPYLFIFFELRFAPSAEHPGFFPVMSARTF